MVDHSNEVSLRALFYELSLDAENPTPGLLRRLTAEYPQYAEELVEFAERLILEGDANESATDLPEMEIDRFVAPAMSRYQARLYEQQRAKGVKTDAQSVVDCFSGLTPERFRSVADVFGINRLFLSKVRDRLIKPETIPQEFIDSAARILGVATEAFQQFVVLPPALAAGASYRAEEKPQAFAQQSFEEAVRTSGLSIAQQEKLLGF